MDESVKEGCIMRRPPLFSTVRVNTRNKSMTDAKLCMESCLNKGGSEVNQSAFAVEIHKHLPDLLVIAGSGPRVVEKRGLEVYVDRMCGNAITRGAQLYASGILGSNRIFSSGDICSVWMDVERKCLKGRCKEFSGPKVFLGNGEVQFDRKDIFNPSNKAPRGVGVRMIDPVWKEPSLNDVIEDWGFPQNLPSVLCGHVLDPKPGHRVLDMCAAPGGKSTHITQLMDDSGLVICLDHNPGRVKLIEENAKKLKLNSIRAFKFDSTMALDECEEHCEKGEELCPPFRSESFDRILIDAPCSGIGQRPTRRMPETNQMASFPVLQRKILENAVKLLKKSGVLVYSTCTLREEENEAQIRWMLDKFLFMNLTSQAPLISPLDWKSQSSLSETEAGFIQKFDPRKFCVFHEGNGICLDDNCDEHTENLYCWRSWEHSLSCDQDNIGFFIAKLQKM